ncbi:MAG: T9SS type A sorting domain-containing protein [Bacteroidales bacterium]|jgi:hypothetical protein|nr:T9SS type A sorting domain-containing protein [Bacteroidales bacterium]
MKKLILIFAVCLIGLLGYAQLSGSLSAPPKKAEAVTPRAAAAIAVTEKKSFEQDFAATKPMDWSVESENSDTSWIFTWNGLNYTACAEVGAKFNGDVLKLITPVLNVSTIKEPFLKFTYQLPTVETATDKLEVFYKTTEGEWTSLGECAATTNWTGKTISLPELTEDFQIAFVLTGQEGGGAKLEDLSVEAGAFSTIEITNDMPFVEPFRSDKAKMPNAWTQDNDTSKKSWTFETWEGRPNSMGRAAVGGYLTGDVLKLISPVLNVTGVTEPALKFWYQLTPNSGQTDPDKFEVFYKTTSTSTWISLGECAMTLPVWTENITLLPEDLTEDFQISFVFTGRNGNGVKIDDIFVGTAIIPAIEVTDATPFVQQFTGATAIPAGWTEDSANNAANKKWSFNSGGGYIGGRAFTAAAIDGPELKLITPALNTSGMAAPTLKFRYQLPEGATATDELTVYYKGTRKGEWEVLKTYTAATGWTREVIELDPAEYCYIAFEVKGQNGAGVSLDDIYVETLADPLPPVVISTFPWTEQFEATDMPRSWTQDNDSWSINDGKATIETATITKLITPRLDFTQTTNPKLIFKRFLSKDGEQLDTLRVYYRTSATSNWLFIKEFTANESPAEWKIEEIALPSTSADYYIAFEAKKRSGAGEFSVDSVSVNVSNINVTLPMNETFDNDSVWKNWAKVQILGDRNWTRNAYAGINGTGAYIENTGQTGSRTALITPSLTVPDDAKDYVLQFRSNLSSAPGIEQMGIYISTEGRADFSTFELLKEYKNGMKETASGMQIDSIALNDYKGETIHIAFVHQGQTHWALDDIHIGEPIELTIPTLTLTLEQTEGGSVSGMFAYVTPLVDGKNVFALNSVGGMITVDLTPKAEPGYLFKQWWDGNTTPGARQFSTSVDDTVYAEFVKEDTGLIVVTPDQPWAENFNAGAVPGRWAQIKEVGDNVLSPNLSTNGTYALGLSNTEHTVRLVTPAMDVTHGSNPVINFSLYLSNGSMYGSPIADPQDTVEVYYKTEALGEWKFLKKYAAGSITGWQNDTLGLPEASADYYVSFVIRKLTTNFVFVDNVGVSIENKIVVVTLTQTEGGVVAGEMGIDRELVDGENPYQFAAAWEEEIGISLTLRATPEEGFKATTWWDGVPVNGARNISGQKESVEIYANFEEIVYHDVTIAQTTGGAIQAYYRVADPNTPPFAQEYDTFYLEEDSTYTFEGGQELTLVATADDTYEFVKWMDDSTSATRTLTVTADVEIAAEFREIETSVSSNIADQFRVYPNPVADVLNIQTEQTIAEIAVLDQAGRVVKTQKGDLKTLDMQDLKKGQYIVRIHTAAGIATLKVVKQ